ncbi:MAG: hypothetical protein JO360_04725 [Acidobacteria bacterium]|nr:hypothetical protein [Acidobacteriota bacterium]
MSDSERHRAQNLTRRDKELRASAFKLARVCLSLCLMVLLVGLGCSRRSGPKSGVRPRTLRDVPAQRLAYTFNADTEAPAQGSATDEASTLVPAIQNDFDTRRKDDALLRTQLSPDRQRALAIYATGADEPNEFRLDLYGADGNFLRHITPEGLAVVFAPVATWSPDGNFISFIAYKSNTPQPTPTPFEDLDPEAMPSLPTASPAYSPPAPLVPFFTTEQIYICNRDGYDLRALTTREGLIYFYLSWSPDSHALAALACRENEWRDRPLLPAGRPRLIGLDGSERLLDDGLTDVLPVWSPDASKVATAFETEVKIYDALTDAPTTAAIKLGEPLLAASRAYDQKEAQKSKKGAGSAESQSQSDKPPVSFNPIVTLNWPQPETLYLQTGFVRSFENEQVRNFMRWHLLKLSAQAALLN